MSHTVGLKLDGTVIATGYNINGQCNVSEWKDIIAISAGNFHTLGLKSDVTVVAVGKSDDGQCYVSNWRLFNDYNTLEEQRKNTLKEIERLEAPKTDNLKQGLCPHCGGVLKGLFIKKCSNCGKLKDY